MQLVTEIPAGFREWKPKYGPYSASRLITARCPQRFFGQYVRGDKSIGFSLAASRGSAIHEVCAKISQARVQGVTLTPSLVDQWIGEAMNRYPAAYEQVELVKAAAGAYIGNPNKYANETTKCEVPLAFRYFEQETMDPSIAPKVLLLQEPYESKSVFLSGRLDQVTMDRATNTITVLDHKSTPRATANEDINFQMGLYAWFIHLLYPAFRIRTVIHYAHPDLNFYASPVYWEPRDLEDVGSYTITKIRAIEAFSDFPAIPGKQCDYCHMVQQCDVNLKLEEQRAKGMVDLNVRSVQDLQQLCEQMHVTGKLYDELQGAFKEGLEKFGITKTGIAIDGLWYGFKTSDESVDWAMTDTNIHDKSLKAQEALANGNLDDDTKRKLELLAKFQSLKDVLVHYGVEPDAFKSWQGQKLKQLWRLDKPELIDQIKEYIVMDRGTRFGGYKL